MNTVQKALALINQEFAHQQQALALAQDRQKHLQDDCDRACAKLQQEQERSQELAKSAEELRQTQDWHPQELAKLSHVVWDAVREHAAQLIVYGAQALNYYLRPQAHLTSTTRDWWLWAPRASPGTSIAASAWPSNWTSAREWSSSAQWPGTTCPPYTQQPRSP